MLVDKSDYLERERIELALENQKKIVNYHYLLNDNREHTLIDLSQYKEVITSFRNYKSGNLIIKKIIEDLRLSSGAFFELDLLKLFENTLHLNHYLLVIF